MREPLEDDKVSTHSHPKVAGLFLSCCAGVLGYVSTHSHPKVAGGEGDATAKRMMEFQHTATRRWLAELSDVAKSAMVVSTHSHPKVAGCVLRFTPEPVVPFQHTATRRWLGKTMRMLAFRVSFNTQPPEGGWESHKGAIEILKAFQHTATRRWLVDCLGL